MREKLLVAFSAMEVKELITKTNEADETGSFTGMVISTEDMDRQGEVVMQAGMDTANYMLNPVVLNSHNYAGIHNIVGVTTRLYPGTVNGKAATLADGKFAPTEEGQLARKLWDGGFLNASSVGFIPTEYDKENSAVITKWELLEYSFVPVPANAKATRYRTFEDLGLDTEVLRAKGFIIDAKADDETVTTDEPVVEETKAADDKELGGPCDMEDGGNGVWATDPNDESGPLVCLPNESKSAAESTEKGAVGEALQVQEDMEAKYERMEEFWEVIYAFCDVYYDAETTPDQFDTLLAELVQLLSNLPANEEAEKSKLYMLTSPRLIKHIVESHEKGLKLKAGRTISDATAKKLVMCMENLKEIQGTHLEGVITALGELSSSSAGGDTEKSVGAQEGDSDDVREMNDFLFARTILRSIDKTVETGLAEFNKRKTRTRS